ncbi:hypothetical protein GCM10010489_38840 [Microbacterium saperdae]|uniref:Secreted protein n=2 Tax=Microbacterium saperdae TaxID=69368 RepID=A0A543BKX6_9MICO|nr:secreted protein [Microbacterium saperdae]GGM63520.1 hypothetical protein GCM10010489_38840 [Microbacterium saperdae]
MSHPEPRFFFTRRGFLTLSAATAATVGLSAFSSTDAHASAWPVASPLTPTADVSPTSVVTWDTRSDSWAARDGLGRVLPDFSEVGPPREDRFVGMFYFLWLGEHTTSGPWNIEQILAAHPEARDDKTHPAWGPMNDYHHWSEPAYGYYLSSDEWVIRRHARQLVDAGVDVVIFDATNGFDYPENYTALFDVYAAIRAEGERTPDIAFMCPWDPAKPLVKKLYQDIYAPGVHSDLWFTWKGKPLVLSNPALLGPDLRTLLGSDPAPLPVGATNGQTFTVAGNGRVVGARVPTWGSSTSGCTLTLRAGGPGGAVLATRTFTSIADNSICTVAPTTPLAAGTYYLEQSAPVGTVGWWTEPTSTVPGGQAYRNGTTVAGDRELYLEEGAVSTADVLDFFTFRDHQISFFAGQTGPNQWSWLEDHPQHEYLDGSGAVEQMSVSVAQNALNGRLAAMSEPTAQGRSFHAETLPSSGSLVRHGLNFQEQWDRVHDSDPEFVFVTGWNEWVAMRLDDWLVAEGDVIFVDQFDQEHSRDIEPMKGGHGDDYYYQLVSNIRRFKGVRDLEAATTPTSIAIDGSFSDWAAVGPTFRDHSGETAHRSEPGWGSAGTYTNTTGRNEILLSKVARDATTISFYVETAQTLTPRTDPNWMLLAIGIDGSTAPEWEGFQFIVNRTFATDGRSVLEASLGGWSWSAVTPVDIAISGNQLELAVPRAALGLAAATSVDLRFKWIDNPTVPGDMLDLLASGDTAPNGRFSYRYRASLP